MDDIRKNGKVTAIIPVRKGSSRCKNKNIRKFGDTNLLELKIKTLKKCKLIDYIMVSSNCDKMLQIAKNHNVLTHRREEKYCTTECNGSDFHYSLAKAVKTELMFFCCCTAPFVLSKTFDNFITLFRDSDYNCIHSVTLFKNFLYYNNKPVNFDKDKQLPSQLLPNYMSSCGSSGILSFTDLVVKEKYISSSNNPYYYILDDIQGMDIDTNLDFYLCELIYKNKLTTITDVNNYMDKYLKN